MFAPAVRLHVQVRTLQVFRQEKGTGRRIGAGNRTCVGACRVIGRIPGVCHNRIARQGILVCPLAAADLPQRLGRDRVAHLCQLPAGRHAERGELVNGSGNRRNNNCRNAFDLLLVARDGLVRDLGHDVHPMTFALSGTAVSTFAS